MGPRHTLSRFSIGIRQFQKTLAHNLKDRPSERVFEAKEQRFGNYRCP